MYIFVYIHMEEQTNRLNRIHVITSPYIFKSIYQNSFLTAIKSFIMNILMVMQLCIEAKHLAIERTQAVRCVCTEAHLRSRNTV